MVELKLMCAFIAELLGDLRDDPEFETVPFVYEMTKENRIEVYVQDVENGLMHYSITVANVTVREVYNDYLENDLVKVAAVSGYQNSTQEGVCFGSLFHGFAGFDDPVQDRISTHYDMSFFRHTLKYAIGGALNILSDKSDVFAQLRK